MARQGMVFLPLRRLPIPSGVWHKCGKMARPRRTPTPLDPRQLEEIALAYVARFATSRTKLEGYLARKLRERGWADEAAAPVEAIAARMVAAGYVDDGAYARAKGGSLLRRGYGARRISQALQAAGIGAELREAARPGEAAERHAALALAAKRRLGPFSRAVPEREQREKQLAAMLRAGHRADHARAVLSAADAAAAEAWACELDDGDEA